MVAALQLFYAFALYLSPFFFPLSSLVSEQNLKVVWIKDNYKNQGKDGLKAVFAIFQF